MLSTNTAGLVFAALASFDTAVKLLDEVHRLIETRKTRFLLTGSSARKLRRGGSNLLGGCPQRDNVAFENARVQKN